MNSAWHISESDYPQSGTLEDKIRFFLGYAILAPSAHNTQPWRCKIKDNQLHVFRDSDHTLKVGDPTLRETTLGIGAFVETFIITATHFGYACEVFQEAFRTTDALQAIIALSPGEAEEPLFGAIPQRHTNRGMYADEPLQPSLLDQLAALTTSEIKITTLTDSAAKERVAALVKRGIKIALTMRPMKEELAELVSRESEGRDTGMMVEAMLEEPNGNGDGAQWVHESMDVQADSDHAYQRFAQAPALIIIGTDFDGPLAWLRAGRTLQRVLLLATKYGYTHDIAASPVEVPPLTPRLRQEIDPLYRPQVLVRIGKPLNPSFTKLSGRRTL